jgi:integrase
MFSSLTKVVTQVLDKIAEKADEELLLTVRSVRKRMIAEQLRHENGETTEEEYREEMDYLRKVLEELKAEEERT